MCGLIGLVDFSKNKFYQTDHELLSELLYLNCMRGMHSTGVFGVDKDTMKTDFIKAVGGPWELESYKDFDLFKSRMLQKYVAVVGHGRFATRGNITARNSHPFVRGHITLVHNGTIDNFEALRKGYDAIEVDSDLVANLFAKEGEKETLKKLRGPYAFIWHNEKENALKFCRNWSRPLYFMKRKFRDQIILSSESANLQWIAAKHEWKPEVYEIFKVKEDCLYTVDYQSGEINEEMLEFHVQPINTTPYMGDYQSEYDDDFPFPKKEAPEKKSASAISYLLEDHRRRAQKREEDPVEYQVQGFKAKIGARIPFRFTDYSRFGASHIVRGSPFHDVSVDISGHFSGDIDKIIDAEVLTGKVTNIVSLKEGAEYYARVFVTDIRLLEVSKENFVSLLDSSKISLFRFYALAKDGCSECQAAVLLKEADKILVIKNKIYCPECSKVKYDDAQKLLGT